MKKYRRLEASGGNPTRDAGRHHCLFWGLNGTTTVPPRATLDLKWPVVFPNYFFD